MVNGIIDSLILFLTYTVRPLMCSDIVLSSSPNLATAPRSISISSSVHFLSNNRYNLGLSYTGKTVDKWYKIYMWDCISLISIIWYPTLSMWVYITISYDTNGCIHAIKILDGFLRSMLWQPCLCCYIVIKITVLYSKL